MATLPPCNPHCRKRAATDDSTALNSAGHKRRRSGEPSRTPGLSLAVASDGDTIETAASDEVTTEWEDAALEANRRKE